MAITRQWAEWHLTPRGWELGSTRLNGRGNDWKTEPADRVLSCVYSETAKDGGEPQRKTEESWRIKGESQIEAWLQKFGDTPQRLS
jgi:hypothetical protein